MQISPLPADTESLFLATVLLLGVGGATILPSAPPIVNDTVKFGTAPPSPRSKRIDPREPDDTGC